MAQSLTWLGRFLSLCESTVGHVSSWVPVALVRVPHWYESLEIERTCFVQRLSCGHVRLCDRIETMKKKLGQSATTFDATQKILKAVYIGLLLVAAALLQFPSLTYTGIGAAGLAMLLLTISHFRKRGHARGQSNELADLAQQMGWSLSEEDEYLLGNLWGFELSSDQPPSFVLGREGRFGREIADVLDPGPGRLSSGQEYEVRMFRFWQNEHDHSGQSGRKGSHFFPESGRLPAQTVIWFRSPQLSLPSFVMRPEHVVHKIGSAFGYQDIDFDSNRTAADFSKKYLLRGADEHAIRSLFKDNVLDFFATHPGKPVLEGRGDRLILYRPGQLIRPENISVFLEEGLEVFRLFVSSGHG